MIELLSMMRAIVVLDVDNVEESMAENNEIQIKQIFEKSKWVLQRKHLILNNKTIILNIVLTLQ